MDGMPSYLAAKEKIKPGDTVACCEAALQDLVGKKEELCNLQDASKNQKEKIKALFKGV